MDGFEATRQLKINSAFKSIPVIALSASVFEENQRQSSKAGCDDFIPKPVRVDVLLEMLQKHIDIEWTYDKDSLPATERVEDIAPTPTTLIPPQSEEIEQLAELAKIGDIRSIVKRLQKIEESGEQYGPFVTKIQNLAKQYKMQEIRGFINTFLGQ